MSRPVLGMVVRRLRLVIARLLMRPRSGPELIRLGSAYGGWWVPRDVVRPGTVAYCAGAGEDISFDLALDAAGCAVVTFDPTPRAIAHVGKHGPQSVRYRFVPIGWWDRTDTLRFYSPQNESHVSHSVVNLQKTDTYFEAPVMTVRDLMVDLGDDSVDLIKMDIEGAEHAVIESIVGIGPLPTVLCVEFDQPSTLRTMMASVRRLKRAGYTPVKLEGWNATFVRVRR